MAMLIKLLATKMVANSFLGLSKSFEIILNVLGLLSKPSSKSVLFKEKRATSAPDISAEQKSNRMSKTKPKTTEKSIVCINEKNLVGSGSNECLFN